MRSSAPGVLLLPQDRWRRSSSCPARDVALRQVTQLWESPSAGCAQIGPRAGRGGTGTQSGWKGSWLMTQGQIASFQTRATGRDRQPQPGIPRAARPWVAGLPTAVPAGEGGLGLRALPANAPFPSRCPIPHAHQGPLHTGYASSSPPPTAVQGLGTALLKVSLHLYPHQLPRARSAAPLHAPPRDGWDLTCTLPCSVRSASGLSEARSAQVSERLGSEKEVRGGALLFRLPSEPSMLHASVTSVKYRLKK